MKDLLVLESELQKFKEVEEKVLILLFVYLTVQLLTSRMEINNK